MNSINPLSDSLDLGAEARIFEISNHPMSSSKKKIISDLSAGDTGLVWLIESYKTALAAKAASKASALSDHPEKNSIEGLLKKAGSPIQSWLLAASTDQFPEQHQANQLQAYLQREIDELSHSKILYGAFEPTWAQAYFIDDPKMFKEQPPRLSQRESSEANSCLMRGQETLKDKWGAAFEEYISCIKYLAFFDGVNSYSGGSTPRSFGVIYQSVHNQDPVTYANTLVHEVAHHIFNIFRSVDQIILDSPELAMHSPLRNTQRPLWGVFHSAFSMYRMLEFCRRAEDSSQESNRAKAIELFSFFWDRQVATLELLKPVRKTDFGAEIYRIMINQVSTLK